MCTIGSSDATVTLDDDQMDYSEVPKRYLSFRCETRVIKWKILAF